MSINPFTSTKLCSIDTSEKIWINVGVVFLVFVLHRYKTQIKIFLLVAFVVGTFLVNLWLPTKSQGEIKYSVGNWLEGTGTKMVVIWICSTKLYDVKGYYCSIMLNSCSYNLIYAGFFLSSLDKIKKSIFWVMVLRNLSLGNGHGYQGSK